MSDAAPGTAAYTPTTEQVKDVYHLGLLDMQATGTDVDMASALEQFDRWLLGVCYRTWEGGRKVGYAEGKDDMSDVGSVGITFNPYGAIPTSSNALPKEES